MLAARVVLRSPGDNLAVLDFFFFFCSWRLRLCSRLATFTHAVGFGNSLGPLPTPPLLALDWVSGVIDLAGGIAGVVGVWRGHASCTHARRGARGIRLCQSGFARPFFLA